MKDRSKNLKKHEAFQRGLENYATSMATYNVDDSITIYVKTILREYIKRS